MQKLLSAAPSSRTKVGELLLWLSDDVIEITNEELNKKNISISKLGILVLFWGKIFLKTLSALRLLRSVCKLPELRLQTIWIGLNIKATFKGGNWEKINAMSMCRSRKRERPFWMKFIRFFLDVCADFSKALTDEEVAVMLKLLSKIHDSIG